MSMDRSLKSASALVRHRNVLTRAERLVKLSEEDRWNDTKPVYGLPKVAHRKMAVVKSEKAETAEGDAAATPAAGAKAAAPAAGGKAAPAAKGAAPAAKGAAPAAKAAAPAKKK
jgi:small basic protein (TIGR04137 family)